MSVICIVELRNYSVAVALVIADVIIGAIGARTALSHQRYRYQSESA